MIKRRDARELAFVLIFEKSFTQDSIEEIIENAQLARDIRPSEYTMRVANGVFENIEPIDAAIAAHSRSRSLSRLSRVVLAVLRLSLYEIMFLDDIETSISINEAVELAKKYAGEEEAGYVNGVLGGYVRSAAVE